MTEVSDKLAQFRASIDNLDAALIHILAERFRVTQAVGQLKATHDLPPSDPDREKRQIERLRRLADEADLLGRSPGASAIGREGAVDLDGNLIFVADRPEQGEEPAVGQEAVAGVAEETLLRPVGGNYQRFVEGVSVVPREHERRAVGAGG